MKMEDDDIYIWRDGRDKKLYHFGFKFARIYKSEQRLKIEDISVLYGEEVGDMIIRKVTKNPVKIKLNLEVIE